MGTQQEPSRNAAKTTGAKQRERRGNAAGTKQGCSRNSSKNDRGHSRKAAALKQELSRVAAGTQHERSKNDRGRNRNAAGIQQEFGRAVAGMQQQQIRRGSAAGTQPK